MNKFCDNCEFLNITEEEQDKLSNIVGYKLNHICKEYGTKLYHNDYHPNIVRCDECIADDVTTAMDFGEAIEALKAGKKVYRKGWNGKDMFIELSEITEDVYTLKCGLVCGRHNYIYMKTADNMLVPWTASQTDILAEDWEIRGEEG